MIFVCPRAWRPVFGVFNCLRALRSPKCFLLLPGGSLPPHCFLIVTLEAGPTRSNMVSNVHRQLATRLRPGRFYEARRRVNISLCILMGQRRYGPCDCDFEAGLLHANMNAYFHRARSMIISERFLGARCCLCCPWPFRRPERMVPGVRRPLLPLGSPPPRVFPVVACGLSWGRV